MKDLFQKRRFAFHQQCLSYLRYVLNDHFVLVIIFLLGFLLVQYQHLLTHLPTQSWLILLVLGLLAGLLLVSGNVATYLEAADAHFLLPQEKEIKHLVNQAVYRSFLVWVTIQSLILGLTLPLFLAMGYPVWVFVCALLVLAGLKYLVLRKQTQSFFKEGRLQWQIVIRYEQKRRQAILRFFSLFTNVKGLSSPVKRRSYLDGLLKTVPLRSDKIWQNLYLRAFLRSGDYLGLTLRLVFLSVLSLVVIEQRWLAESLVALWNYLLLFQLLSLYHHFDSYYPIRLYPLSPMIKTDNLLRFLRQLYLLISICQGILAVWFGFSGVFFIAFICQWGYLSYKVKKLAQ